MANEAKKALVVDDELDIMNLFLNYGNGKFDVGGFVKGTEISGNPNQPESWTWCVFDYKETERKIREIPYAAILLDGKLGLGLMGRYDESDGDCIAKRIRDGVYGTTNRDTPIYSISSSFGMFSRGLQVREMDKPHDEKGVQSILQILNLMEEK